jgi:outer membrane receptor protein involved in Fe transport
LYYTSQKLQATINYSYCYGKATTDSVSGPNVSTTLRVADIAANKANAIINYRFLKHYDANFRCNYVGQRLAGQGTTSPSIDVQTFPGYFLANLALSAHDILKLNGMMFQLCCNNIFNKTYYTPGVGGTGGRNYSGDILQMGRNFFFKIGYEF